MIDTLVRYKTTRPWVALNHQQRMFVEKYLGCLDAPEAAKFAGYADSTCKTAKAGLLQQPKIQAAISIAREARVNRTQIDSDKVVEELAMIGFFNFKDLFDEAGQLIPIEDMPDRCGHVIASITEKVDQALNVTTTIKIHSKLDALKMIAQHLGMLVDRKEISGPNGSPVDVVVASPAKMSLEEWEKKFG